MSNTKIKNQLLVENCQKCNQTDCFDTYSNYCSRCSSYNTIPQNKRHAFSTIATTIPDICPLNITVVVSRDSCTLRYHWFTKYVVLGFLAVFMFAGSMFYDKTNLQVTKFYEQPAYAVIGLLVLWMFYICVAICVNKTYIKVTSSEVIVSQRPLPWLHNHHFSINQVSRVYVDEKHDTKGYAYYRVRVSLKNGSIYTITPYMINSETAFFISDQLYKWVRVIKVTA